MSCPCVSTSHSGETQKPRCCWPSEQIHTLSLLGFTVRPINIPQSPALTCLLTMRSFGLKTASACSKLIFAAQQPYTQPAGIHKQVIDIPQTQFSVACQCSAVLDVFVLKLNTCSSTLLQIVRRQPLRIECARVGGVEIPNQKRIEFSLQYIYGVGHTTAKAILVETVSGYVGCVVTAGYAKMLLRCLSCIRFPIWLEMILYVPWASVTWSCAGCRKQENQGTF